MSGVIVFQGVTKAYGRVVALRDASFSIPRGSIAGLLGPNGSGKTTSLKLALGLLRPTSGTVRVRGMDPWVESEARRWMGFLPESPLYPRWVRVGEFLEHMARLKGVDAGDVGRVVKLVGLEGLVDRSVGALSRGYLQRLGLAQALLGDPEVLLLDEPTANLDPLARVEILRLIRTVRELLDATVVISSHILPELQEVVDRLIIISRGRVLDEGPVDELARRHGVGVKYIVSAPSPREVAARILWLDAVEAIRFGEGVLEVSTSPGGHESLEEALAALAREGLVRDFRAVSGSLGDLYEAVVGS